MLPLLSLSKSLTSFYSLSTVLLNSVPIMDLAGKKTTISKEILSEGNGAQPQVGDVVSIHYTGTLSDGSEFDSSRKRNEPFNCQIGTGFVIQGWDLAVPTMKVGEKAKLTIPHEYGYGPGGFPPVIPPKATLIFEVELLDTQSKNT